MNTIKIAITDDHPLVINGFKSILPLYPNIQLVGTYHNAAELLIGLRKQIPDVLLLDIQLPDKPGDEIAHTISKQYPSIKMLALTNFDSTIYVNAMFIKGVQGYILKSAENELLIHAIETVFKGEQFLDPFISKKIDRHELQINKKNATKLTLTLREKQVLKLIIKGATNGQIGEQLFLSAKTIDHYRTNIMLKLDVNNVASLVAKALKMGLTE